MFEVSAVFGLFVAAFVAATPVPFQSELIFLGLQASETASVFTLVVVASLGNTLGSCLTYWLGRGAGLGLNGSRFAPSPEQRLRAEAWFGRWGIWALLFSWAPGGDLVCLLAGALRSPFWLFALLVGISKTARYIVLAGAAGWLLG